MGMADATLECHIDGRFRCMDIVQFKEEPNQAEDAMPGEKLLIKEVAIIDVPELKPSKYSVMYMQRNPPGAMPGCTIDHIKASMDFLLQDFGYNPDRVDNKPAIYVSVLGIDLDDHEAFMDEKKWPGGNNPVKSKDPVGNIDLVEGQA